MKTKANKIIAKNVKLMELSDFWEDTSKELNTQEKLQKFLDIVNKHYDDTRDANVLFGALHTIAIVNNIKLSKVKRNANIKCKSICNIFRKNANLTAKNLFAIANNLGIHLHLSFSK
jgi:DNA-binding phage protein